MSPRRRTREGGFTLLEVVVAMALFAVLMTVLYSGFTTVVRAYEAAGERGDRAARMRVISDFLRRSLGAAFPMAIASRQDWTMIFEGGRDRLRYVADMPGYLGVGGLHEVVLETERDAYGEQLVMRRRPLSFSRDGELLGEFDDHVLLEAVAGFELRYFGGPDDQTPPQWQDRWTESRRMPLLVELRITDEKGEPWPPVLVRPQVDTVRYQSASGAGEVDLPRDDSQQDATQGPGGSRAPAGRSAPAPAASPAQGASGRRARP